MASFADTVSQRLYTCLPKIVLCTLATKAESIVSCSRLIKKPPLLNLSPSPSLLLLQDWWVWHCQFSLATGTASMLICTDEKALAKQTEKAFGREEKKKHVENLSCFGAAFCWQKRFFCNAWDVARSVMPPSLASRLPPWFQKAWATQRNTWEPCSALLERCSLLWSSWILEMNRKWMWKRLLIPDWNRVVAG